MDFAAVPVSDASFPGQSRAEWAMTAAGRGKREAGVLSIGNYSLEVGPANNKAKSRQFERGAEAVRRDSLVLKPFNFGLYEKRQATFRRGAKLKRCRRQSRGICLCHPLTRAIPRLLRQQKCFRSVQKC